MFKPEDYYISPNEFNEAEKHGVSRQRLITRVRAQGWSKDKAIYTPPRVGKDRKYWVAIALENGISKKTFYQRVNKNKWCPKRAATTPIIKDNHEKGSMRREGKKYAKEILNSCAENGISRETFYSRIKRGWAVDVACTRPPLTPDEIIENMQKNYKNNIFSKSVEDGWKLLKARRKL